MFAKKNPDNTPVKAYDVVIECIVYDDEAIVEISQKNIIRVSCCKVENSRFIIGSAMS